MRRWSFRCPDACPAEPRCPPDPAPKSPPHVPPAALPAPGPRRPPRRHPPRTQSPKTSGGNGRRAAGGKRRPSPGGNSRPKSGGKCRLNPGGNGRRSSAPRKLAVPVGAAQAASRLAGGGRPGQLAGPRRTPSGVPCGIPSGMPPRPRVLPPQADHAHSRAARPHTHSTHSASACRKDRLNGGSRRHQRRVCLIGMTTVSKTAGLLPTGVRFPHPGRTVQP